MEKVVCEVLFDDVTFVSATDNEIVDSMSGVELHDVPEDWFSSDFDHGFWFEVRLFGDAGSEASGKYYCFHYFKNCSPISTVDRVASTENNIKEKLSC